MDEFRHGDYPVPASPREWKEITLPFSCQAALTGLRLDPNTSADYPLEIDSIVLRDLEPNDIAKFPADSALLTRTITASRAAGRMREAVLLMAKASVDDPKDTNLSLSVASCQAWFGQDKELAVTLLRIIANAKATNDVLACERAAKACSVLESKDQMVLDDALALGRTAVKLGAGGEWNLLALGMAEYRNGKFDDALEHLPLVDETNPDNGTINSISRFYRAMSLFRLGKQAEARPLAIEAASRMKTLPADEQNPMTDGITENNLVIWLAYKEAKALIHFDAVPPQKTKDVNK
jgi:Flp pilus assembly protein TadD